MQSGHHGRLPADALASVARARIKEPARKAKNVIASFRANPDSDSLKDAVILTEELVKVISELAVEDLACASRTNLLLLSVDYVHKIVDFAKQPEVVAKLQNETVVAVLDKFVGLIDKLIVDLKADNFILEWASELFFDDFKNAVSARNNQIRGKLDHDERMALYYIYLLKGDLLRYKSNMMSQSYVDVLKAYRTAYCFCSENGNLFQLLAVTTLYADKDDLLGHVFYVCRAISAVFPFESCSESIKVVLGGVTEKLIKSDFAKHCKIFENPSLFDVKCLLASAVDSSQPNIWFFSEMKREEVCELRWRHLIARQSKQSLKRMMTDTFFQLMNMTMSKLSHEMTVPCANMFICYMDYMLDEEKVTGKEVVQVVSVFLSSLMSRRRDLQLETMKTPLQAFFTFIGLLLTKVYDLMLVVDDGGFEAAKKRVDLALPALAILGVYWSKISEHLPDELLLMSSYYFDSNLLREKVMKLGPFLNEYLASHQIRIEKLAFETKDNDALVLPEMIYATLSNKFAGDMFAAKFLNGVDPNDSMAFRTFLMRISLVSELLVQMTEKRFCGLNTSFLPLDIPVFSTFELYVTSSSLKNSCCYAVYPEYIIIDTNTLIDKFKQISAIIKGDSPKFKIISTPIVMSELAHIAQNENRKSASTKAAAQSILEVLTASIQNKCRTFQIYNYYGERKFDFEFSPRDVIGLGAGADPARKKANNDDHIIQTCLKLEDVDPKNFGFQSANIKVRRCVLITDDKIMRINARALELVSCAFDDFYKWFTKSI